VTRADVSGVDPDHAPTADERDRADRLADIINQLPTLTVDDIAERHAARENELFDPTSAANIYLEKYRPPEHDLPGFGEAYEECGWQIPHVCEDHGHDHNIGRTCRRSVCPRCGASWVAQRAVNITARIMDTAKMLDGAQYKHHTVASPPPHLYIDSDDWYGECMDVLEEWMDEIGMQGIILPHPYSGKSDEDGFASVHEDDRGEWKHRLFADRSWEGDVRHELQHRPHFHIIGVTPDFPGGDETSRIYDRTKPTASADHGWVFHRITERNGSPISLGEVDDVARAVSYALSHGTIDTSGDRNSYLRRKVGSAFNHNNTDNHHHQKNVAEAREAVHQVIGDTLGIDWTQVGCHEAVHADDCEHDPDVPNSDGDGDGDDSGDSDPEMRTCHSTLTSIHEADFIDEDWASTRIHGDRALELKRRWEDGGGWQGWVDRGGELPTPPP